MSPEPEFRPQLDESVGYGVVVGVGFFFAGLMLVLTTLQAKFSKFSPSKSEEFTCERVDMERDSSSIEHGGIHLRYAIVSLSCFEPQFDRLCPVSWSLTRWYGVGGTIQLAFFAMVAAKVKMKANGAHTFLEIVKARFGTGAHLLFTFYAFLCILVVCGSLLLGGSATVTALTGMNTIAACFLLPIGIAVYVVFGGLRATFICDWAHTIILFIIIYLFVGRTYGTSPEIGGIRGMYALLKQAGIDTPVQGNEGGSYLTMKSNQGITFGAATILSGFSGVFCDQGIYFGELMLCDRKMTPVGSVLVRLLATTYMLGGLSWFAVPWAFASCLGLAARALVNNTSAGLAAPAAATVVMGKGGAVAILLVVFMAVTSASSAELIAVSSLFSYDLYRTYFRPSATGAEIVKVSHYFICFWAVWMGAWATILFYVQGVVLSPSVIPIGLTVTWSKLSRAGVFSGCIIGAITGMLAWMIGCWKIFGAITVANLAEPYSAVCSGLTGLLFSGVITILVSLWNPANYDFEGTRAIIVYDKSDDVAGMPSTSNDPEDKDPEQGKRKNEKGDSIVLIQGAGEQEKQDSSETVSTVADVETLQRVFVKATWYSIFLTGCVAIFGMISLVPTTLNIYNTMISRHSLQYLCRCSFHATFSVKGSTHFG
ncbi:hypothetical protein NLI96_g6775 [Meripilus lineatus]|uniref:Urea active transporter n=1 Tax=Meripilus lineatus TaxID=2056292 RepID=A0AAD5V2L8_9APHY|nr:hypothetical protein NLI96_g6775 [Physisporinus lineatus]